MCSSKRCLITKIPWGSIHFNVIAVESARFTVASSPSSTPRFGEVRAPSASRSHVRQLSIQARARWRSSQVEFESRVEAGRQTPATSLDHEQPRLQLQNNKTTLEKTQKKHKTRPIKSIQTTRNNPRKCPPQLPTAPPPPPPQQQTMPATRPVSSARSLAHQ